MTSFFCFENNQQGQHPNAVGDTFNPAQNNSPRLHHSAGQFAQVPQDTTMNTEVLICYYIVIIMPLSATMTLNRMKIECILLIIL